MVIFSVLSIFSNNNKICSFALEKALSFALLERFHSSLHVQIETAQSDLMCNSLPFYRSHCLEQNDVT